MPTEEEQYENLEAHFASVSAMPVHSDAVLDALLEGLETDARFRKIWSEHPNPFKRRMAASWADFDAQNIRRVVAIWRKAIGMGPYSTREPGSGCTFVYGVQHLLYTPGYNTRLWLPISWMFDCAAGVTCCDLRGQGVAKCWCHTNSGYVRFSAQDLKPWQPIEALIESPIEALLYAALQTLNVQVEAQFSIGPYRLDFACQEQKLAIECDGHDYHASKEQRAHDAKRDRYLLANGWRTARFTGSEIYSNAAGCALEVKRLVG